jgi:pimeloyl-ACP methyl ester carboxylesterase
MTKTLHNVRYWTYNNNKLPTCLFIHGFTGSHEGFQYILPNLTNFHVIMPDLPGFGQSKLTLQSYTIDELAKKVNEFVTSLQLDTPPYLVSHSMGGLVAASMLTQSPELFAKKTIFISPVATKVQYLDSRKLGEILGRLQYFLGKTVPGVGPRVVRSRLLSRIATKLILTTDDKALEKEIHGHHFKNLNFISSIHFYHKLHKDINKKGAIDYAPQIIERFKPLIITGSADNVTPLSGEKRLAHALNARLVVIPEVGHLLHYERPIEVAAAVNEFLNQ